MSYVFTFDATSCTGCKACQAACKDKNNLPVGVLWRRVIEVSGGDWVQNGGAWDNNVFSYNYSTACNHCVHPKCAGVCPVNAYNVREDGIVLLDSSKCIGCGYCNWACPYAVPQLHTAIGVMTKCNFCFDLLDTGQPPACVAACPMRVLGFEKVESTLRQPGLQLWDLPGNEHPFPLPTYSRTQPHVRVLPHPAMLNHLEKTVANREEIKPRRAKSETPLLIFTLLAQTAVGLYWANQWTAFTFGSLLNIPGALWNLVPTLLVGLLLGLGMLLSFFHLGNQHNAWRVLGNLRKSWLSREILSLGFFAASWLAARVLPAPGLRILTCLLGLGLLYSMSNVYRLRSMAAWNTPRTLVSFLISALLLGGLLSELINSLAFDLRNVGLVLPGFYYFCAGLLPVSLLVTGWGKTHRGFTMLRIAIVILLEAFLATDLVLPLLPVPILFGIIFIGAFLEEALGRWLFYSELDQSVL